MGLTMVIKRTAEGKTGVRIGQAGVEDDAGDVADFIRSLVFEDRFHRVHLSRHVMAPDKWPGVCP